MNSTSMKDLGFKKFLVTVGTNLKGIRTTRQLKVETVADATGISADILDQIENGNHNWEVDLIKELCAYFEIPVKDLVIENSFLQVNYSESLKKQLENIKKASNELATEVPNKSVKQFLAEVDFTKMLLDETKPYIH